LSAADQHAAISEYAGVIGIDGNGGLAGRAVQLDGPNDDGTGVADMEGDAGLDGAAGFEAIVPEGSDLN
jgi:hypothetical protein